MNDQGNYGSHHANSCPVEQQNSFAAIWQENGIWAPIQTSDVPDSRMFTPASNDLPYTPSASPCGGSQTSYSHSSQPQTGSNVSSSSGRNSSLDYQIFGSPQICISPQCTKWANNIFDTVMVEKEIIYGADHLNETDSAQSVPTKYKDCTPDRVCDRCTDIQPDIPQATPNKNGSPEGTPSEDIKRSINATIQTMPCYHTRTTAIIGRFFRPTGEQLLKAHESMPKVFYCRRDVGERSMLYCELHKPDNQLYCQTCCGIFCNKCVPENHVDHVTVSHNDATSKAQEQAGEVLDECQASIATIKDDIDQVVMEATKLDVSARQAVADVWGISSIFYQPLHDRQTELVKIIHNTCVRKQSALIYRNRQLNLALFSLNKIAKRLIESIRVSFNGNPADLLVSKDEASAEMFQVKYMRNKLPPLGNNFIRFESPPTYGKDAIHSFGKVLIVNGHVADIHDSPTVRPLAPSPPVPCGRAIPSASRVTSVTDHRNKNNFHQYRDIGLNPVVIDDSANPHDRLCRPWGVACDHEGHIIVADRSNNRVKIYLMDGTIVRTFGTYGAGRGQFNRLAGIAVDARRRIVVVDKDNHRVQVFTMEGRFLLAFGGNGSAPGLFNYPWDVSTNSDCQIVVSDSRNYRIQLFSGEGIFLRKFSFAERPHRSLKTVELPRGVAFNTDGEVIVSDFTNHRIIVVNSDFTRARILGFNSLAPYPKPARTLFRPQGVAVDDQGHIIVSDSRRNRLQILNSEGFCMWSFDVRGEIIRPINQNWPQPVMPYQMKLPAGVAIGPNGQIIVVDFGNDRLLIF